MDPLIITINDLPEIIDQYENLDQDQDQDNSITHIIQYDFDEVVANQLLVNNVFENVHDLQYIYIDDDDDDDDDEFDDNEVIPYDSPIESDAAFYTD